MELESEINKTLQILKAGGIITNEKSLSICSELNALAGRLFETDFNNPFISDTERADSAMRKAWQEMKAKYPELSTTLESSKPQQPQTQSPAKPDFNLLKMYLDKGFILYAYHYYTDKEGNQKSGFCNIHGYGEKQDSEKTRIDSPEKLQSFIAAGIENFKFFPAQKNYMCFDIDRGHKDGADGLRLFTGFLKSIKADRKEIFKNIDKGIFPAYTSTPSGGMHLYFKTDYLKPEYKYKGTVCRNTEIKSGKLNLTAAGSVKNGVLYTFKGNLDTAPQLPAYFLEYILNIEQKQPPQTEPPCYRQNYTGQRKQGYSLEQLAEYGRENAEKAGLTNPHYLCVYIGRRMLQNKPQPIDRETIINFLQSYELTRNHDFADIKSTVYSL